MSSEVAFLVDFGPFLETLLESFLITKWIFADKDFCDASLISTQNETPNDNIRFSGSQGRFSGSHMLPPGSQMLAPGCQMLDSGFPNVARGYKMLFSDSHSLAPGCQMLPPGSQMLAPAMFFAVRFFIGVRKQTSVDENDNISVRKHHCISEVMEDCAWELTWQSASTQEFRDESFKIRVRG